MASFEILFDKEALEAKRDELLSEISLLESCIEESLVDSKQLWLLKHQLNVARSYLDIITQRLTLN